ncbi:MAG: Stringent starvation protein B [uncultured bacterium]|nr:MAG: Stringent starvation protein B [uncultured bacterium]
MLSNRPYLLRAFNEWIIDSACTPILVLDATNPRCKIPQEYVDGGEIVFNISPSAVRDLRITNEAIEFKASFSGIIHIITAPIKAILAIYAEENGEGIFFDAEEDDGESGMVQLKAIDNTAADTLQQNIASVESAAKSKPFLKLVE